MLLEVLLLVLGFGILIGGASWLVDGGSALAKKYNISDLAIGLTIVAFGTSMPEFVVNTFAAINGHNEIVFGNVIGSNIFNLLGILGVAGLITPLVVRSSTVWKEIPISFLAALILWLLANRFFSESAILTRFDGIILLVFFCFFLLYVYRQMKIDVVQQHIETKQLSNLRIWLYILGGLAFLIAGGRLVVTNSVKIAEDLGISQTVIGLTIVAIGTSLPELATSVVAAIKKNNDIAVGNIIGSNIFNIFFILGVSAVINPAPYNLKFNQDLYLLGAGTLMMFFFMFISQKKKLERWEAGLLLMVYLGYTTFLVLNEVN